MTTTVSIHWFRKGLRLHDNPALIKSIANGNMVLPIFILDPYFVQNADIGQNRWIFLLECLQDINKALEALGSRLFVIRGEPIDTLKRLFDLFPVKNNAKFSINSLTFEKDTEPYAISRDSKVEMICKSASVSMSAPLGHTLFDPAAIIRANRGGSVPLTYQSFLKVIDSIKVGPCLESPKSIGEVAEMESLVKVLLENMPQSSGPLKDFGVPSYSEILGLDKVQGSIIKGGESIALKKMDDYLSNTLKVLKFEKPSTSPAAFDPASTTVLSPYLKMGALSVRLFYQKLKKVYEKGPHTIPPVSLLGQLYWREFYYTAAYGIPNFGKMVGNSICTQIDWRLSPLCKVQDEEKALEDLYKWEHAQTGYPWIDAIMTQLRQEGWIHHLARHSVACFLTRGDLYISWEKGAQVFERLLIDADYSLNNGNWLWLSASAFFHQYFRVYSPVAFPKKYDPNGDYVRKYLPALKNFPQKYIYEPWKAPIVDQKKAGCIIGKDYPKRMVDHDLVSKQNIQKMKAAYELAKDSKKRSRE